jgi:hypothetical protein
MWESSAVITRGKIEAPQQRQNVVVRAETDGRAGVTPSFQPTG